MRLSDFRDGGFLSQCQAMERVSDHELVSPIYRSDHIAATDTASKLQGKEHELLMNVRVPDPVKRNIID